MERHANCAVGQDSLAFDANPSLSPGDETISRMSADLTQANSAPSGSSFSEERLRSAMLAGKMGIWELGLDRRDQLLLSPELQSVLGFENGQFDGRTRTLLDRIYPADRAGMRKSIVSSIRQRIDLELEVRFLRTGKSCAWLLARGKVCCDKKQRPVRLAGVGFDITNQKLEALDLVRLTADLQLKLNEGSARLQATNQELESLCYSVSHDLRAPLRSIRGFSEVLLERYVSKLDARGQEFLRRACQSSRQLDDQIDNLLKLSRVGRSELVRRSVNLSELATSICVALQHSDSSRAVAFQITPNLQVGGDEHLLQILLDNLLGNAWKFTSKRSRARIEFGFLPAPKSAFFVRDNGAGFDPAYAGKLFSPFQRLHSSSEFSGTGIGLATVQRIISRHGGRVWAEGEVDRGATFYFSLPHNEAI